MANIITVEVPAGPEVVQVSVPGIQGPKGPEILAIGPTNTLTPGEPGLWIQTGLGDGSDITFWIEDGE